MHHKKRPAATAIANGADIFSTCTAEDIHSTISTQALPVRRISSRLHVPPATAATIAELAWIGGAG